MLCMLEGAGYNCDAWQASSLRFDKREAESHRREMQSKGQDVIKKGS